MNCKCGTSRCPPWPSPVHCTDNRCCPPADNRHQSSIPPATSIIHIHIQHHTGHCPLSTVHAVRLLLGMWCITFQLICPNTRKWIIKTFCILLNCLAHSALFLMDVDIRAAIFSPTLSLCILHLPSIIMWRCKRAFIIQKMKHWVVSNSEQTQNKFILKHNLINFSLFYVWWYLAVKRNILPIKRFTAPIIANWDLLLNVSFCIWGIGRKVISNQRTKVYTIQRNI